MMERIKCIRPQDLGGRSCQVVLGCSSGVEPLFQPHFERRVYLDPTHMTEDDISTRRETNQLVAKIIEASEMINRAATHGLRPWAFKIPKSND